MRNHMGGYEGRKLEKGDRIGFVHPKTELPNMEKRKIPQEVFPTKEITLRVVTGPQDYEFSKKNFESSSGTERRLQMNLTVWDAD